MIAREDFIKQYWPIAVEATKGTDVDPGILMAQVLQEGGTNPNRPGNNFLNMTAGSKWSGPTLNRGDTDAAGNKIKQNFRAYDSPLDSFKDYTRMMSTSPRYAGLLKGTREERAAALGKSGYAEDPTYGQKVGALAAQMPGVVSPQGTAPSPAATAAAPTGPGGAMATALKYQGMNETANKQALGEFMAEKNIPFTPDNIAWCARFVNSSLAANGQPTTGSNMARSFLNWGQGTDAPKQGDIAVFQRGGPNASTGHVGFYDSLVERDGKQYVRIFGGNQGGSAKGGGEAGYTEMPVEKLLGYRTGGETQTASAPPDAATGNPPGVIAAQGGPSVSPTAGADAFASALADVQAQQQRQQQERAQVAAQAQIPAPSPTTQPGAAAPPMPGQQAQPGQPDQLAAADLMTSLLDRKRAARVPLPTPRGMLSAWG